MRQELSKMVARAVREAGDAAERLRALDAREKKALAAGTAAGVTSAAGTFGAAMMTGTTAAGVAISSLHGAACTSATLAALGGGSLAAGGLGMAGGAAVLGASCAVPAVLVASLVARGAFTSAGGKGKDVLPWIHNRIPGDGRSSRRLMPPSDPSQESSDKR